MMILVLGLLGGPLPRPTTSSTTDLRSSDILLRFSDPQTMLELDPSCITITWGQAKRQQQHCHSMVGGTGL